MEKITVAVIGGGAAGLFLATALENNIKTVVFEKNDRVGKKLSATGNGQGNVSNLSCAKETYFSHQTRGERLAKDIVTTFDCAHITSHFEKVGLFLCPDERGRVYPSGKQASSLTDALRFYAVEKGVELRVNSIVKDLEKIKDGYLLTVETSGEVQKIQANYVVLCTGGKAAKNFGTDGSAYALAQRFGHTLTPLTPSLVQLKTDTAFIKTLKGIKIPSARVTARWKCGEKTIDGDLLFTDYGVSGDSIFRLSAYCVDKIPSGVTLHVDLLPNFSKAQVENMLKRKRKAFPTMPESELLCGIVNNQVGRAIFKRVGNDLKKAAACVKEFTLQVQGSLGFDYAQVTKGGISVLEIDNQLQSTKTENLYFAGEILDIDGPCGGFNLQWAYASACQVADAIAQKVAKAGGQV